MNLFNLIGKNLTVIDNYLYDNFVSNPDDIFFIFNMLDENDEMIFNNITNN
jgi:hypothetical protein